MGHYVYDVRSSSPRPGCAALALVGLRAISNVVDITNFLMLELGQPMHAYDRNHVAGPCLVARRAADGEKMVTLDGNEYTLNSSNLLICDAEKPVGVAGVMGGLNSEILPETKEVIFEAAKFARDNIRRTSRALGKRTDASARYEKGVMEPEISDGVLTLQVPAYREDMESWQDVAEEVIRLYGYEHIVPTFLKSAEVTTGGLNEEQQKELKLKRTLCGAGMYECIHYSFFSPADLEMPVSGRMRRRKAIRIMNPLSEELSLMRTTLTASMINAVVRNQKNGNLEGRLFEIAKIFVPKELPLKEYPDERDHLVMAFFGGDESFYTIKGACDLVAETLHMEFTYEARRRAFCIPISRPPSSREKRKSVISGKLAYDIAEEQSLRTDLYLAELDLKALYDMEVKAPQFEALPEFPEVSRDLALIMDKTVTCAEVEKAIKESCKYVRSVKLFDVYEGLPIPPTRKSMAFTVTFRPKDHEFTGEEIDRFVEKILKNLNRRMEITRRD